MPCENELILAKDADVIVHETTYIEGDKNLANDYYHSHIDDVLSLMTEANVKRALFTHLSNRYEIEEIEEIEEEINKITHHKFNFVNDYETYQV